MCRPVEFDPGAASKRHARPGVGVVARPESGKMVRMHETIHDQNSRKMGLLLVGVLLSAAVGCSWDEQAVRQESGSDELPIVWQKSGTYSRMSRMTHVVVRDAQTLARIPIAEVPVDFDTQMVLIVGLGPTPSNELGVRITRVWQQGSRIRVQERRIHPGAEHAPGLEPASPWTIAVVPKSDLNVEGFQTRVPPGTLGEHPGSR